MYQETKQDYQPLDSNVECSL